MIRYLRLFDWVGFIGLLMVAAVMMLSGCGSAPAGPTGLPRDQELERLNRAARQAFDKGRLRQAASFYRNALDRAYLRDDSAAILDAQFNLATCLLNLQSYDEALEVVRRADTEMTLIGQNHTADFLLLEATILQRHGDLNAARQITDQILSEPAQPSSVITLKTHFLRGLIASEQGDLDKLRAAITALGQPQQPQLRADRQELLGRLAMAEQNWEVAIEAFERSINLRRETLDYRGMVRTLVLAGEAGKEAGHTRAAAIFYLRAGRSAFLQEQFDDAQKWLNESVLLANSVGEDQIKQEARHLLRQIESLSATPTEGSENKPAAMK